MKDTLEEFRKNFLKGKDIIADISQYGDIPIELYGEDVYDYFFLFKNEEIAINYVCQNYSVNRDEVLYDLHEEDYLREKYGKENYLRSAEIEPSKLISELNDGTYILWESY